MSRIQWTRRKQSISKKLLVDRTQPPQDTANGQDTVHAQETVEEQETTLRKDFVSKIQLLSRRW